MSIRRRLDPKLTRRWFGISAACLLATAASSTAHASTGAQFQWIKFPVIEVQTNGTSYTGVTAIGYGWEAEFNIDSGVVGKIKSWKVWPGISVTGVGSHSLSAYAASKSYAIGDRPKHVHKTVGVLFPDVAIRDFALQVCNYNRTVLKNQGHSDAYVFGKEHKIATTIGGGMDIDVTQGKVFIEAYQQKGDIICKKWQGSVIPQAGALKTKTVMQVTKAKLSISPAYQQLTTDCPVTVPLVAEFEATEPGTLQFRFVSAHGQVSQTYAATITGKTNGVYQTKYEKQISVPLAPAPSGNSGGKGGAINQAAGGGFATATPPIDPIFPSGQSKGGMTQFQNQTTPGNVHSESFRVEVLSPNTGVVSDYHGYHITCKPKQNPGVGTPNSTFGAQSNQPTAPVGNMPLKTAPSAELPARRK